MLGLVRKATRLGSVREVGSTAVEGVIGKEDIDIAVVVPGNLFKAARADLDRFFERDRRQISNDEYQGYRMQSDFDAAIQLTVAGSSFDTFSDFVEILLGNRLVRKAYNELKMKWDGQPMEQYRNAKAEFIEKVLQRSADAKLTRT